MVDGPPQKSRSSTRALVTLQRDPPLTRIFAPGRRAPSSSRTLLVGVGPPREDRRGQSSGAGADNGDIDGGGAVGRIGQAIQSTPPDRRRGARLCSTRRRQYPRDDMRRTVGVGVLALSALYSAIDLLGLAAARAVENENPRRVPSQRGHRARVDDVQGRHPGIRHGAGLLAGAPQASATGNPSSMIGSQDRGAAWWGRPTRRSRSRRV